MKKAETTMDLTAEYYGSTTYQKDIGKYELYCSEIADPYDNETGWECAEWHLVAQGGTADDAILIARCNGYEGVEWQLDDEQLLAMLGGDDDLLDELRDSVTPYNITGDLIAAARAATKEDADEHYDGECQVWIEYNYYAGTINGPNDGIACDDDDTELTFGSYAEAQAWIDQHEAGTYYLAHGEAGRPSYRIVKA